MGGWLEPKSRRYAQAVKAPTGTHQGGKLKV